MMKQRQSPQDLDQTLEGELKVAQMWASLFKPCQPLQDSQVCLKDYSAYVPYPFLMAGLGAGISLGRV
jgi:hypothetical protein